MGGHRLELSKLSKVGAQFGEVVLDPAGWVGVMEDICAGVGALGAALLQGEARLASIMAGGVDLRTAAEELGVARDTARNQLKAIFAKTGAYRRSELVELPAKLQT